MEDFVDEDTGEVTSIERNEVVIERETVLEPEHMDEILASGVSSILLHKESDQHFRTIPSSTTSAEGQQLGDRCHPAHLPSAARWRPADDSSAREVIRLMAYFFSENDTTWVMWVITRSSKKLNLDISVDTRVLTKGKTSIEIIKY